MSNYEKQVDDIVEDNAGMAQGELERNHARIEQLTIIVGGLIQVLVDNRVLSDDQLKEVL